MSANQKHVNPDRVDLVLPMPPTVNNYYGIVKGTSQRYLMRAAKLFRHEVALIVDKAERRGFFGDAKLAMRVDLHFARDGDVDNRLKPLLDALEYADLFGNDRRIDDLRVVRGHRVKGGRCLVTIWRL